MVVVNQAGACTGFHSIVYLITNNNASMLRLFSKDSRLKIFRLLLLIVVTIIIKLKASIYFKLT